MTHMNKYMALSAPITPIMKVNQDVYTKQARLKRAEYMLMMLERSGQFLAIGLTDFERKQALICHRLLSDAYGDLPMICKVISRYRRVQPSVLAYLLLRRRFAYTDYSFINRSIRVAVVSGIQIA